LTESQYIEVAEMWGWKKAKFNSADPNSFDCWIDENSQLVCDDTVIDEHASKAVNSWQGFGRTVEAMDKRGWRLINFLDGADHNPALGFYSGERPTGASMSIIPYIERHQSVRRANSTSCPKS